jgi:hypothetical protein
VALESAEAELENQLDGIKGEVEAHHQALSKARAAHDAALAQMNGQTAPAATSKI